MLVAQLLPFVKNLATRKWSDEDILEDVQFLIDELNARFESLTCVSCIMIGAWDDNFFTKKKEPGMSIPPNSPQDTYHGHQCTIQTCSGKRMRQS